MADDDYYAKLDRLDEQARRERAEMLERQDREQAELDRRLGEQKLAFDEHYRRFEELREVHAQEHRETMARVYAETLARERGPDGPDAPGGAANGNLEEIGAAQRAAEQSRQDIAASRFAAQFALDQAHELEKQREIAATIGGIDDPEMAAYVAEQQREIEARHDETRRVEVAREEHERNARNGVERVSFERHVEADAKVFEARREDLRQEYALMQQERTDRDLKGIEDREVIDSYMNEIKEEYARKLADQLDRVAREEQARLERTRVLYGRDC